MKVFLLIIGCITLIVFSAGAQTNRYAEPHRPQFHFSPPAHWMNDPNGLVFYKGEYHLFYQYYPDSTIWGPMHWGHAISKDLMHWQPLPIALFPDSLGYIFSGSVVVDKSNSSGFKKGNEAPLVAIFTYHNMAGEKAGTNNFQTQGIAYSIDQGRTWTKYAGNPVIKNPGLKDFRDPKVMWHEASKHWILTMAAGNQIRFYRSTNLKNWELTGTFGEAEGSHGGVWECPDLFFLKTEKANAGKWVLLVSIGSGAPNGGSGTQYFIGDFDGKNFKNDYPKETICWLDRGTDNYAGVTWSNIPDGRRIFLGWMSNWQYAQKVPTQTWRSAMTLPRELSLEQTNDGYRLLTVPVKETALLRRDAPANSNAILRELELEYDLTGNENNDVGIELKNKENESIRIGFNDGKKELYINRTQLHNTSFSKEFPAIHTAPVRGNAKKINLHLFIDQSSVEVFVNGGELVMTDIFFPEKPFTEIVYFQKGDQPVLKKKKEYELRSIW